MRFLAALIAFFCLALPLQTVRADAAPSLPALTGRVVDDAHILSEQTKGDLDQKLEGLEAKTSRQLVVVTLPSLQGYEISDYGYQLGRAWGIGQKGQNNGVLFIVVPSEHKVRIEVGYGLEGRLTDAASRVIIEDDILPAFRRGDFNMGVLDGAAAILGVLGGSDAAAGAPPRSRSGGSSARDSETVINGLLIAAIWLFIWWMMWRRRGRGGMPFYYFGPGFGGGGSSGGGAGGFAGGGGSFGGGGASGRW